MKKLLHLILAAIFVFTLCLPADAQDAAEPPKKTEKQILEENVEILTKKVYGSSLFSSEDSDMLIEIRTQLNAMADTKLSSPAQAKLFYNAAFIFKAREYKQDAIQYFKVVLENFPETVYSKRAISELEKYGVNLNEESEEEE